MKKNILLILAVLAFQFVYSQAPINDTFVFDNSVLADYHLYLKNNDPNSAQNKILSIVKLGGFQTYYTVQVIDSQYVNFKDTSLSNYDDSFRYFVKLANNSIDSATVIFSKASVAAEMFPGDCNNDNLVNHFDIFPIGLLYGERGYARHNLDTLTSFLAKKSQNWNQVIDGFNAKFIDVDGNSRIDTFDFIKFQANIGQSKGTYFPKYSSYSSSVNLSNSIKDTIEVGSDTFKQQIPIQITKSPLINSYGIGFTYEVHRPGPPANEYPKQKYLKTNVWDDPYHLFIIKNDIPTKSNNVGYVRLDRFNKGMDGSVGIIEIVVDEILLGLANVGDVKGLQFNLKNVAIIDNTYKTIDVTPVSKTIYFKKVTSGILDPNKDKLNVYPTLIYNQFTIEKTNEKSEVYTIYNALGQQVQSGILDSKSQVLNNINWPKGIYYLKLNHLSTTIKLQKQ